MILALVAVAAAAIATTDDDDQALLDEQVPAPNDPTLSIQQWDLTIFPGAGVFVDLATGPTGTVALTAAGTDWANIRRPSHVWASDAELTTWSWVDVERSAEATITSVTLQGETIVAAGYLHADGFTPALWAGAPETGIRIIDEALPAVERLSLVRNLGGQLVVVGVPTQPSGLEGSARLLVGAPGDWTDITPQTAVDINEVISTGDKWIAVGQSESQRPGIWHSEDQGASWTERPPTVEAPATISDITIAGNQILAVARLNPLTSPTSQLLRLVGDSWRPAGEPRTLGLAWISPVGEALIGGPDPVGGRGPHVRYLWQHEGDGRWAPVSMRRTTREDEFPTTEQVFPTTFATASDQLVAGSAIGQPAIWTAAGGGSPTIHTPADSERIQLWERVAVLPPDTHHATVLSDGTLVAMTWGPDVDGGSQPSVAISEDGTDWTTLPLPSDLRYVSVHLAGEELVFVGPTDFTVVVGLIDENEFVGLAEIDGTQLEAVDIDGDRAIIYVRVANTTSRTEIPLQPGGPVTTTDLNWDPLFILAFDDGVVVGGESETFNWPADALQVSTDAGETWTQLAVVPQSVHSFGPDLLVVSYGQPAETYLLRVDPIGLDPIELLDVLFDPSGRPVAGWAGGLAAYDPSGRIHVLQELGGPVATLEVSPATGFDGVFVFPAGEQGHIVAMEMGERVLYRWTGQVP